MPDQSSQSPAENQAPPTPLLIGSVAGDHSQWKCCEWSTTVRAHSARLQCDVLIAQECKRWGCNVCGRKRVIHLAKRTELAKPTKFITLTTWTMAFGSPRKAYDGTRRALRQLTARVRKQWGEFEYLRVLEAHKNGYPHYHLAARCPYIPQQWLSDQWAELAESPIVDVRQVQKVKNTFWYMMKYLAKQKVIPWTNRRVSYTKAFFQDEPWQPPESLDLAGREWLDSHPADVVGEFGKNRLIQPISSNCWLIGTRAELERAAQIDQESRAKRGIRELAPAVDAGEQTTGGRALDTPETCEVSPVSKAAGRPHHTPPPQAPGSRAQAEPQTRFDFATFVKATRTQNPKNEDPS